MLKSFVLRTQDRDVQVERKCYMSESQAQHGFSIAAGKHLGQAAHWFAVPTMPAKGYWINPRGDVLEMRAVKTA